MDNIYGFISLNCYALIVIFVIAIIFFSKKRLNQVEDRTYSFFIIANIISTILGIILGLIVFPDSGFTTTTIKIVNKLYLFTLVIWGSVLTYYTVYVSFIKNNKNYKSFFKLSLIIITIVEIFTLLLPIETKISNVGAVASGLSIYFLYTYMLILILVDIIFIIIDRKNIKSKKYFPIYLLIILGGLTIVIQIIFPSLNYLINPCTILITFIMYHTIENPDVKMLREFHKQRELANESNEEKTSFLFNMSNQIKEPILAISNISGEALLEDDMEEVKDDLRRIKSSSSELLQLVNDVLDISDIEKRKIGIRGNKYNIYNLFEVLNKNFSKSVNKKIAYRFHFDKSIPEYLYGDSIRIKQVMNILLENALEYTNEGFIEVNVNSIMKHDICRLIITVEDSGIGMSTEEIKHLFDKEKIYSDEELKQVDDTKNNLGVLKSIVNLMNGNVLVNSELGKGSKFTIIIDQKVKEEKTKIIETVEQYEEMYENKEKILLVINHKEISKKINKMFKKDTYEIEEVSGGQACLEKIRKNEKFDLIIVEEDLEKLSSEDTLIKLKDTSGYKIPVILISNNKGFGAKEMYQEKGFKDVLFLPLKKEEVLKQVEEYIKD